MYEAEKGSKYIPGRSSSGSPSPSAMMTLSKHEMKGRTSNLALPSGRSVSQLDNQTNNS